MKPLTLYDFLRVGHVKRWHNVNTIRDQTVAEHSYMVTVIAIHLASRIRPEAITGVAFAALFHDSAEVVLGDSPTPAKRFIREFTKDSCIFEKMESELVPSIPYIQGDLDYNPEPFVKVADKIEAAYWISENGAGKHAEIVQGANWRNLEDYVEKLDEMYPDDDWYTAVNEILMALGMRYVYKQARITPP